MTVIAFDGRSVAADRRLNCGTMTGQVCKVFQTPHGILAGAGSLAQIREMLAWLNDGAELDAFPDSQRNNPDCPTLMQVLPAGQLLIYEDTPYPYQVDSPFWAIGSGAPYAMAAMHLGKSAREAVEVACALDSNCGNGIDELVLGALPAK